MNRAVSAIVGPMTTDLGWDDDWQQRWDAEPALTAGAQPGRVVRVERTHAHVALDGGVHVIPSAGLAVGDWVATDGATWAAPLPRRTQLARQSVGRESTEQVLAANIDAVLVVEPALPPPNPRRVERLLTLAWGSGARPVVVLTKQDLAESDPVPSIEAVALGVEVIGVSARTGHNVEVLAEFIHPGQTFVLIGTSGAGKSSLINALAGREILATGDVRDDGTGRHTTTRRELIVIDGLGCLIDTPGVRTVGMTANEIGLDATFDDVLGLAQNCHFSDCSHSDEPGCAVLGAIESGQLSPERLESYRRIEREIAHQKRRREVRSRADERLETRHRRTAKRVVMNAKGRSDGH